MKSGLIGIFCWAMMVPAVAGPVNLAQPPDAAAWNEQDKTVQAAAAKRLLVELKSAITARKKTFTIPPGVYRFGSFDGPANLQLVDLRDFTLKADGVLFYYNGRRPNVDAIVMKNCRNVKLSGLALDCDPLGTSQGEIVELDRAAKRLKIRIDAGFPLPVDWLPRGRIKAVFFAPNGKARGTLYEVVTGLRQTADDPCLFDVKLSSGFLFTHENGVKTGDRMVLPDRNGQNRAIAIGGGGGNTLDGVTIYSSPDVGIAEMGGDDRNSYLRCRVILRPGTKRLLASNADIFRSIKMKRGPLIEDCDWGHTADDILNIHSYVSLVWEVKSPDELVVIQAFAPEIVVGSELSLVSRRYHTALGTARVVAIKEITDPETVKKAWELPRTLRAKGDHMIDFVSRVWVTSVKLDRPIKASPYDLINSFERCGAQAEIRRNYFHDTAVASGIHYKGRDAVFEDNRLERIGSAAILVSSNIFFQEGPNSENLIIRRNRISDSGYTLVSRLWPNGYHAAIAVYTGGPRNSVANGGIHNRNIRIENNEIIRPGAVGILLSNAEDCAIVDNRIEAPAFLPTIVQTTPLLRESMYAVYLANCRRVELKNNQMSTQGRDCLGLLGFGPNVTACGPQLPTKP